MTLSNSFMRVVRIFKSEIRSRILWCGPMTRTLRLARDVMDSLMGELELPASVHMGLVHIAETSSPCLTQQV